LCSWSRVNSKKRFPDCRDCPSLAVQLGLVPQAMSLPLDDADAVANFSATLMLCVERKIVVPVFASARKRSLSVRAPRGSMPTIGSSMIRMRGSWISAAQTTRRCFMPCE
jgi:hypothetical protein